VQRYQVAVHLAYYPPYQSTYNPIERWWGILETPYYAVTPSTTRLDRPSFPIDAMIWAKPTSLR